MIKNIIIGILVLFLGGAIAHDIFQTHLYSQQKDELSKQLSEANLNLGRAQTEYGDAQKHIKELELKQQSDIILRGGKITEFGEIQATLDTKPIRSTVSSSPIVRPDIVLSYEKGRLYRALDTNSLQLVEEIPFRYQDHRVDIDGSVLPQEEGVAVNCNYQLHIRIGATETEVRLPSGDINRYISIHELDPNGKPGEEYKVNKYDVVIDDQQAPHFVLWAPHIDVGVIGGAVFKDGPQLIYGGSVGFSVMGYGKTNNDLSWKFIRAGLNLNKKGLGLDITPFEYNIAQHLPLLSNLWLGPQALITTNGYGAGLFMSVGL